MDRCLLLFVEGQSAGQDGSQTQVSREEATEKSRFSRLGGGQVKRTGAEDYEEV